MSFSSSPRSNQIPRQLPQRSTVTPLRSSSSNTTFWHLGHCIMASCSHRTCTDEAILRDEAARPRRRLALRPSPFRRSDASAGAEAVTLVVGRERVAVVARRALRQRVGFAGVGEGATDAHVALVIERGAIGLCAPG